MTSYTTSDNVLIIWEFDPACTRLEQSPGLYPISHTECITLGMLLCTYNDWLQYKSMLLNVGRQTFALYSKTLKLHNGGMHFISWLMRILRQRRNASQLQQSVPEILLHMY